MKLSWLLFVAVEFVTIFKATQGENFISKIQEINSQFSTETNVFFDFDECLLGCNLEKLQIPTIVISQLVDFQFIYALDKDILAVACISKNSSNELKTSLSHVLHRMHHVNVIFYLLGYADPHSIFHWAWKNGFKNSLALYSTEEGSNLSEFYPFPELTIIKIRHINESRMQKPIANFHQHPLRTPIAHDPPRSFRYIDRNGKLINSGLFLKVFILFVEHYNATVEEVILPEPYPNSLFIPDMIKALQLGKIDINQSPFIQRYDAFLCTYAFELAYYYLMVPYSRPVEQFLYLVIPFDNWTWTAITALVFLFTILIYLGTHSILEVFDFGRGFLQALSGIFNISYEFDTHNSKTLLITYVLLSNVGLILPNIYSAQLSTLLTTHAYEKQINSIEDVIASKLPISIAKYDRDLYESLGVSGKILDKIEIIDVDTWHRQRRILNASRIDIISEEKYLFFAYQQRYLRTARVKRIGKPCLGLLPGFALPFTSPYVNMYSEFFMRIYEAGIYKKFKNDLNDDGIANGLISFIEPEGDEFVPLSLQHFKISIYLLGGGFALATFIFIVEMIFFKLKLTR